MEVKLKESQFDKGLVVGDFRDGVDYGRGWVNTVVAWWSCRLGWPWRLIRLSLAFEWNDGWKDREEGFFSDGCKVKKMKVWLKKRMRTIGLGEKKRWKVRGSVHEEWELVFCFRKEIGNLNGLCKCPRRGKMIWERPLILSLLSYQ